MHQMSVDYSLDRSLDGEAVVTVIDECYVYVSDVIVALWQPLVFVRERDEITDAVMSLLIEGDADMDLEPMVLDDYPSVDGRMGFVYIFGRRHV